MIRKKKYNNRDIYGSNGQLSIKTIQKERVCKYEGCVTILARANRMKYCFVHISKIARESY